MGTNMISILLGTVITATGWFVSHIVDSVMLVPTIEYDISKPYDGRVEVTVKNLSRSHKFSELKFLLHLNKQGTTESSQYICTGFVKEKAEIKGIPPAHPPDKKVQYDKYTVTYPFSGFHPETAFIMSANYKCNHTPTFHIASSSNVARLIEKGVMTWIIRNEIMTFLMLLVIWIFVVLWSIYKMSIRGHHGDA